MEAKETAVADSRSFAAFYADTRDRMVRTVWATIGDRELAADAVDEAFTRAFERWDGIADGTNPEGWVYRTALNWATSRFRSLSVRRRYQHKVSSPEALEDRYTHPELAAHLAALPLEQRTVLVLRYLLDWDIATTAEALGIAPGTVRSRTARASAALRARIDLRDKP
ncbi:MAG: sigma-70 family RNA polymerase sigma factor [Actinomycetota bacterium]